MYDVISIEDRNKPTAVLCSKSFVGDAKSAASGKGMPGIRIVPESVPPEWTIREEIQSGVTEVMGDITAALTKPLTAEEKSPKPEWVEKPSRIIFKGNLEEVNRFFYKRGWADGLPIIPPTEEAVQEMLKGTDLPPDFVVDKIIPRLGKATVEKIAINAVMAGALPTYMPLLIAGVQAVMEKSVGFGAWEVSTGSNAPFWIVNGPIRNDLNINNGTGALSPGDIANAAIGRAMGLIIKNIGGARKGVEDMGEFGNPGKYSMVIAENEEASPWEPLNVEHGYNKEDSTVTIFFPNSFTQIFSYGSDARGILSSIIYNVAPTREGVTCLMLNPAHARILASEGWTKKEIKVFTSEYARVPFYHLRRYWDPEPTREKKLPINSQDSVSILSNPDSISVLVTGGPGNWVSLLLGPPSKSSDWVIKKVELPANWDKLVQKYKDIVPTYIHY